MKYINAYFAITNGCNLSCKYCYVPKSVKKQEGKYLDTFKLLVDKMISEDIRFQSCTFHGVEPTILHGSVYAEMIHYYRHKTGHNLKFRMQTNGINLNHLTEFVSKDDLSIGISLDGYEENHDELRGKGSWGKSVKNLLTLNELGYTVGVMCVINAGMLENFSKVEELAKTLEERNIDFMFKPVHTNDATSTLTLFNELGYELGKKLYHTGLYKKSQYVNTFMCSARGNSCEWYQFNADGSTYACNKYFTPDGSFANWIEEPLSDVMLKRKIELVLTEVNPECYKCKYWGVCRAGCPYDRVEGKSLECYLKRGTFDQVSDYRSILTLKGFHDAEI